MLQASRDVEELAYRVIGAAIEVHTLLGPGLLETSYEHAMAIELGMRGIPFLRQHEVDVSYKGYPIGCARLDLLISDRLIVELKTVETISRVHVAQTKAYLAIAGLELGLIFNFKVAALGETGIRR